MKNENEKRELQVHISKLEKQTESLEAEAATLDMQIEWARSETEHAVLQEKRDNIYSECAELKLELERLRSQLATYKRFNRERCLNNIDLLLAQKNKKLGELETSSGNRPGYLSRMKSGKSSSDPSIEFLMTASDELEVPLDLLVGSSLADLTSTEAFMVEFIRRLISDTKEDKLEWTCETLSDLEKTRAACDVFGSLRVTHPLYKVGEETETGSVRTPVYNSLFFKDCEVKPCGSGYYTELIPRKQRIYVMECVKEDERTVARDKRFYEIYMVWYELSGEEAKKICNTLEAGSPLTAVIDSLIKTILVSVSHIHIDSKVRSAIDAYMNGKR